MMCPVCQKEMYDNREGKKNPKAPDYRCKDKNCKYQFDMKSGTWEPSEYGTGVWLPKEKIFKGTKPIVRTPEEERLFHSADHLTPIKTVAEPPQTPPTPIVASKSTTSETMSKADWAKKDRLDYKCRLTMQAFSLFPPMAREDNPMDRWLEVKDMRNLMLDDLYAD